MATPLTQHNLEIAQNLEYWERKPLLRRIYRDFHEKIARHAHTHLAGVTLELGSGIGNIKEVLPDCLRTDLFPNPWLDRVENAYSLSFSDQTVANIILFDVFHHLEHPGTAFQEFKRVLVPGGRVIIFDPYISLFGRIVYGALHHEPIALGDNILWDAPTDWNASKESYYAAQGNSTRVFFRGEFDRQLADWRIIARERFAALPYVLSGGYSKPQFYPDALYPAICAIDRLCNLAPQIFATRLLVVLEKPF